jgi:hypothetical protein
MDEHDPIDDVLGSREYGKVIRAAPDDAKDKDQPAKVLNCVINLLIFSRKKDE